MARLGRLTNMVDPGSTGRTRTATPLFFRARVPCTASPHAHRGTAVCLRAGGAQPGPSRQLARIKSRPAPRNPPCRGSTENSTPTVVRQARCVAPAADSCAQRVSRTSEEVHSRLGCVRRALWDGALCAGVRWAAVLAGVTRGGRECRTCSEPRGLRSRPMPCGRAARRVVMQAVRPCCRRAPRRRP